MKRANRIITVQIFIFLYIPMVVLVVASFNTGKDITPEKIESIRRILSGDEETVLQGSGKHTSIGMSNVNKRIQLVYGEEYGLFVDMLEDGQFLSKIVLPYEATGQECTNNVKTV